MIPWAESYINGVIRLAYLVSELKSLGKGTTEKGLSKNLKELSSIEEI